MKQFSDCLKFLLAKYRGIAGFTLVELIVVITILAILGTIGFLSLGWYSSGSRDASRLTDIALISKSLDLGVITSDRYPTPDNAFSVAYSGGTVWQQGTFGSRALQQLSASVSWGGVWKKPMDPFRNTDYTYSSLSFGKAYQLKAEFEWDVNTTALLWHGVIETANAASGNPTIAYIHWNYGGLSAKTETWNTVYVLALPSIITNTATASGGLLEIKDNSLAGTLLFNGKNLTWASNFNPNIVVFSGATLPKDDTSGQITALIWSLKTAYSSTDITTNASIASLLNTSTGGYVSLGATIIKQQLGWKASENANLVSGSCTGLPANAVYFNDTTSYTGSNVTSLAVSSSDYRASPAVNTCQFKCASWYTWNNTSCIVPFAVLDASFTYTWNSVQSYTVPANVYSIKVKAWGAGGGAGVWGGYGGAGGYAESVLTVTPGQVLSIYVWQHGGQAFCPASGPTKAWGYAMWGLGMSDHGWSGGASTEVIYGSNRLVVAGGGGGAGSSYNAYAWCAAVTRSDGNRDGIDCDQAWLAEWTYACHHAGAGGGGLIGGSRVSASVHNPWYGGSCRGDITQGGGITNVPYNNTESSGYGYGGVKSGTDYSCGSPYATDGFVKIFK